MKNTSEKNLKKLTLLHSNDMHGDFMSEQIDRKLVGGVAMLSGYIDKVRNEEENTVYCIAGDMFRGSIIDSEYKGISTIEIVNMLAPDVVSLGNHEVDYGIAHLLFIEKLAKFPIINCNLYVKSNHARLFRSHYILDAGGLKILFIGILTEEVIAQTKQDSLIGSIVDVYEAAREVGRICDAYHNVDIDFTVLLTHIGFEEDKKLAATLDPAWGVDIIVGGHSHTVPEHPENINNILIVQAGKGADQIGRFDIIVDTDKNCIHSWQWQIVPIDDTHCPVDKDLEKLIYEFNAKTEEKYQKIITRFAKKLTHPVRNKETELGNLCADVVKDVMGLDIMLFAAGSIRHEALGPIVTLKDMKECFPYDDKIFRLILTGKQVKNALETIFHNNFSGGHSEFYQLSKGLNVRINPEKKKVESIKLNEKPLEDEKLYSLGLQEYHFSNIESFLGIALQDAEANAPVRIVSTSLFNLLEEAFSAGRLLDSKIEGRIVFENA